MSDDAENKDQASDEKSSDTWLEQLGISTGKKKFWSSDKFLSLLAFLISIGTFFTFAYQTYLIQKQQYANTMPYLSIENYRDGTQAYYNYKIGITNIWSRPSLYPRCKNLLQRFRISARPCGVSWYLYLYEWPT